MSCFMLDSHQTEFRSSSYFVYWLLAKRVNTYRDLFVSASRVHVNMSEYRGSYIDNIFCMKKTACVFAGFVHICFESLKSSASVASTTPKPYSG